MKVYESHYWAIFHEKEHDMLTPVYNSSSADMTDDLYKAEMGAYVELVEQHRPKNVLIDCREFYFPIVPELQEWTDANIFPRILASDVKHVAIVIPSELIASLAIEQVMEEAKGVEFTTRYFDDREQAREWLLSL